MLSNPPSLQSWAPAEIVVGGKTPKKTTMKEKGAKRPPHGEKVPKNEKNIAKRHPYEEKVAKRPPIKPKNFFPRGRATAYSCPLPLRAPMLAIAWL